MRRTVGVAWCLLPLAAIACVGGNRHGQLYDVRDGTRGAVVLRTALEPNGEAEAHLASGEACRGQFATTPNDATRSDDNRIVEEETQTGLLLLGCESGRFIKCEFTRDPWAGGFGLCKDSRGVQYSLVF